MALAIETCLLGRALSCHTWVLQIASQTETGATKHILNRMERVGIQEKPKEAPFAIFIVLIR